MPFSNARQNSSEYWLLATVEGFYSMRSSSIWCLGMDSTRLIEPATKVRMAVMAIAIEIETKSMISIPVWMMRTSPHFESLFTFDAITCAAISSYNESTAPRAPRKKVACDIPGSWFSSHDWCGWMETRGVMRKGRIYRENVINTGREAGSHSLVKKG